MRSLVTAACAAALLTVLGTVLAQGAAAPPVPCPNGPEVVAKSCPQGYRRCGPGCCPS